MGSGVPKGRANVLVGRMSLQPPTPIPLTCRHAGVSWPAAGQLSLYHCVCSRSSLVLATWPRHWGDWGGGAAGRRWRLLRPDPHMDPWSPGRLAGAHRGTGPQTRAATWAGPATAARTIGKRTSTTRDKTTLDNKTNNIGNPKLVFHHHP